MTYKADDNFEIPSSTEANMEEIDIEEASISEAGAELVRGGQLYDARTALAALREKYFG